MSREQFVGASNHRLFQDWNDWIIEPSHVWASEWQTLAARGVSLVCNDPFAAAMVSAKIRETHGPHGMVLRSTYSEKDGIATSTNERDQRRNIEGAIRRASSGTAQDAGGILSTLEFDRAMDWIATVMGDAWAIWLWKPGRPGASLAGCWRIITPDRVTNPDDRPDDDRLQRGCELDADGALVAIWVQLGNVGPFGYIQDRKWMRVPIYHPDTGMRQVMHRVGLRLPGMLRGVSMFAPALLLLRQIQGTVEAHVAGKRAQAIHPIIYFTEDEDELKAATTAKARLGPNAALGPMSVLVAKYGSTDVKFMQSNFQGADLKEFLTTMYRSLTAMWGLPWQVVLCEMGDASLSSARAGLDQNDRTCETFGVEHEQQVSRIRDEAIIREEVARGNLAFGTDDWCEIMAGRYTRPPKYSTDRKKDADTIASLIAAKVSPTRAHALFGFDYEDEAEQTARDIEFADAQGLPDPTAAAKSASPFPSAPGNADTPTDQTGYTPATEDQQGDGEDATDPAEPTETEPAGAPA